MWIISELKFASLKNREINSRQGVMRARRHLFECEISAKFIDFFHVLQEEAKISHARIFRD